MRDRLPLMIFAAGFGTRMGALTATRPKPLIELAGRSLIDRAVDFGEGAGCAPIVANTHYLAHMLDPVLRARGVLVSHEAPDILDTGGGLRQALPLLAAEAAVTLNPDAAWRGPNPVAHLAARGLADDTDALLLVAPVSATRGRAGGGDFALSPDGHLTRGGDMVYLGAQILRTGGLRQWSERAFSLNLLWDDVAAKGRLRGAIYPGVWCDVGTPEGLAEAERMLAEPADAG